MARQLVSALEREEAATLLGRAGLGKEAARPSWEGQMQAKELGLCREGKVL